MSGNGIVKIYKGYYRDSCEIRVEPGEHGGGINCLGPLNIKGPNLVPAPQCRITLFIISIYNIEKPTHIDA
jgi:hypothetical protein